MSRTRILSARGRWERGLAEHVSHTLVKSSRKSFIYSLLYVITQLLTQFAKKLCGERVNKKLQKIECSFFYNIAKIQQNPTEIT